MEKDVVRIFSDAQAIQSERASDFDVFSAYGEVIDNSIEADSKNIKIKFKSELDKSRRNFRNLISVAFADDGCGMDQNILHKCLQLGYSSRYGSRKGIGRFGVGMTKGAISQCKKIEVFSKTETSSDWLYTYFDIEEVEKSGIATIKNPEVTKIPSEYKEIVNPNKGTLIVWSKIDRQDKTAEKIIEESKIWIGRTFRKFIFKGINFLIDNEKIFAVDPLYLNPEFTSFPNDPKAIEWGHEDIFEWNVDDPDIIKDGISRKSKIKIRYSLLPKEFMAKGGGRTKAGDHPDNVKRYINRNEGISLLRNDREVRDPQYDIPFFTPKWRPEDRWWGCEVSFDAELDNWFQVKNIKRGAAPFGELREELQERINAVRKSLVTETQKYWDSLAIPTITPEGIDLGPNHGKSAKIAAETIDGIKPKDKLSKDKDSDIEIEKFVKTTYSELTEEKTKQFVEYFRNNLVTIIERPSNSANFFEITHFGNGKSNITYNTNHVFSSKYFEIINELKKTEDSKNVDKQQILILIDLLLIAYSMAESQFDPESNLKAEDFFEDMMRNWGKFLRDLLKTWNEYERK